MTSKHEKRSGLYRSRDGLILGVCRGLAEHFDLSVFWVRVFALIGLAMTGLWPITGVYLVAALLMKPEPVLPFSSETDQEFYDSYVSSRTMGVNRLKRMHENVMRRIQRLEDRVTNKDFDWERRFNA